MTPRQISLSIVRDCAQQHLVPVKDVINSRCRRKAVSRARWHAIKRLSEERKLSQTQIGRVKRLDHTSVLYALRRIKDGHAPWSYPNGNHGCFAPGENGQMRRSR